jgi:hypothetical protein
LTSEKVFAVDSEWDIGLADKLFKTRALAVETVKIALELSGINDPFEELEDEHLVRILEKELIND